MAQTPMSVTLTVQPHQTAFPVTIAEGGDVFPTKDEVAADILAGAQQYPACNYIVANPATNPASFVATTALLNCTSPAVGQRILWPSGTYKGIYLLNANLTSATLDSRYVAVEGYTVQVLSVGSIFRCNADGTFSSRTAAYMLPDGTCAAARWALLSQIYDEIIVLPGTYPVTTGNTNIASNTTIRLRSAVLEQSFALTNGYATFRASNAAGGSYESKTLSANAGIGAESITVATLDHPELCVAGSFLHITSASNPFGQELFQVRGKTGSGPYTIALDRGICRARIIGDTVAFFETTPQNITIIAEGDSELTGTGDRGIEFNNAWNCHVIGLRITDRLGHPTFAAGSFDQVSTYCSFERVTVDYQHTTAAANGLAFESTSRCWADHCSVNLGDATNSNQPINILDAIETYTTRCTVANAWYGIVFGTENDASVHEGCLRCYDDHSNISNCSVAGVIFTGYADRCVAYGTTALGCTKGFHWEGGASRCDVLSTEATKCTDGYFLSNGCSGTFSFPKAFSTTHFAYNLYGNAYMQNPYSRDAITHLDLYQSSAVVYCYSPDFSNTSVATASWYPAVQVRLGRLVMFGARITAVGCDNTYCATNPGPLALACYSTGVLEHTDTTLTGFNGFNAGSGAGGAGHTGDGTIRARGCYINDGHFNDVAYPFYGADGPRNIGTAQLNGATPVTYAFADIKAGDNVSARRTAFAGTPGHYTATISAGVGVVLTGTALDTSTITVEIST